MRLSITLTGSRQITLPVQYNHLVQATIYQLIEQPVLRNFLHEQGFAMGQRKFKLFTFSRLLGRPRFDRTTKQLIFTSPLRLVICSPVNFIVQELGNGFLRQGRIRLGEAVLQVDGVDVADPIIRTNAVTVRMLSPLVVYSTLEDGSRRFTYYYSPFEARFQELVLSNLAKKYLLIYGRAAAGEGFEIVPAYVRQSDHKVVEYKGTVIEGWMGSYNLTGDPQLLEVALHAGLGAKNSQGFGCCELEGDGG